MAKTAKAIDLGQLQTNYDHTKKAHLAAIKQLEKAQTVYDESTKAYHEAIDALKNGSRTVLS